jgi:hypothetical protein
MASNPTPRSAFTTKPGSAADAGAIVLPLPKRIDTPLPTTDEPGQGARGKKLKGHKRRHGKPTHGETVELRIEVSKAVRKSLREAAAERDATAEQIAALVLTAWTEG